MGGASSRLLSATGLKGLINKAGLPLQVDDEFDSDSVKDPSRPPPPSAFTQAYDCKGYFTGVKSTVVIKRPPAVVYASLQKDIHHVFTPMTECHDEDAVEDGLGRQELFRTVRIPFRVAVVTGNLKLRMHVTQSWPDGLINFLSAKQGRLISKFEAEFQLTPSPGQPGADKAEETEVKLDAKIACNQLPPPPFKNLVKGTMVHKIDACMLDLLDFHTRQADRKISMSRKRSGRVVRVNSHRTESGEHARSRSHENGLENGVNLTSHPLPDEPVTP